MARELCLIEGSHITVGRDHIIDHFVKKLWQAGYHNDHAVHNVVSHRWRCAKLDNCLIEREVP